MDKKRINSSQNDEISALKAEIQRLKNENAELKGNVRVMRTIIDHLPDAIYAKDVECRKTLSNTRDQKHAGAVSEKELIGSSDFEFYPSHMAEVFYEDDKNVIRSGQPIINREEQTKQPDGSIGWQLTSKIPLKNDQGKVVGLVGIGRDITDRKEARLALQKNEKLLRDLVEKQGEGIVITDLNNVFTFSNPAADEIFGVKKGQLQGLSLENFLPKYEKDKIQTESSKRIKNERSTYELDIVRPDKSSIPILVTVTPQEDLDGNIIGSFGVFRDFSEQRKVLNQIELIEQKHGKMGKLIPICAWCNKIRDNESGDNWVSPANYITNRLPDIRFTHGLCHDCMVKMYPAAENSGK